MVMAKTRTLDKNQAREILNGFLEMFKNLCNNNQTLKTTDLEKYLAANVQLSSNGNTVCRNTRDYLTRIEKYRNKYSHVEIKTLMNEPLVAEDNAIIHYAVRLKGKPGHNVELNIMAIAKINDENKISNWTQVAHETGTSHWES